MEDVGTNREKLKVKKKSPVIDAILPPLNGKFIMIEVRMY